MTKRNLEASIDIDAAPNQVWHVVSDLKRLPEWSPQCQRMQLLGRLRDGVYTLNWNRQGRKFWPSASKLVRVEPNQPVAFRTLTNNSVWSFEITPTGTGSRLTERRVVPPHGGGVDGHCQKPYWWGGQLRRRDARRDQDDGGSIFMTGSIASVKGFRSWSVHAASKAVLHAYARVWLSELKDRRIRVNALTPGQVARPIQEQLFDEEAKAHFEALIPRGKMGSPEEIATVALFRASDDSSYVNGMELMVDGGTTAV